jgi:hypothetical protein
MHAENESYLARLWNINNGPHPDIQDTMDTIIPLKGILDRFRPAVLRELPPPQQEEASGVNAETKTLREAPKPWGPTLEEEAAICRAIEKDQKLPPGSVRLYTPEEFRRRFGEKRR